MTDTAKEVWHDTESASAYLTKQRGLETAASTLTRKRTEGDGPDYARHGRKPIYAETDLDAYADNLPRFSATVDETLRRQARVQA